MYLVTVEKVKGMDIAPYILKMGRRRSLIPIDITLGRVQYRSRRIRRSESAKYRKYKMVTIGYFKEVDDAAHKTF